YRSLKMLGNEKESTLVKNDKAKAAIWDNFRLKKENGKVLHNFAICVHCNKPVKLAGGISNLSSHMPRHHGHLRAEQAVQGSSVSSKTSSEMEKRVKSTQPTLSLLMGCQTKYGSKSPRALSITNQIARLIIKDLRPYSMVEGLEFVKLIKLLDPRYSIPRRKQFAEDIIPHLYQEERTKLQLLLKSKLKKDNLAALFSDVYVVSYTESTEKTRHQKVNENVEVYKSLAPIQFDYDPLLWWKVHENKCPLIVRLARSILCILATSVASERVFSTAGDIVTAQRASLKPSHVDKLIFLKKNMK
ncbi:hypothetical protein FSP39_005910, partial [Pinctada imbricata]